MDPAGGFACFLFDFKVLLCLDTWGFALWELRNKRWDYYHVFSWSSITWLIIISHGLPYFSWSSNRFFCSIDDYISWVTIFFTSKFGENSTIKKFTGAKVLYLRITERSKKFPLFWFYRLQSNFLYLFISLFFHFCDVVTLVIIHKEKQGATFRYTPDMKVEIYWNAFISWLFGWIMYRNMAKLKRCCMVPNGPWVSLSKL